DSADLDVSVHLAGALHQASGVGQIDTAVEAEGDVPAVRPHHEDQALVPATAAETDVAVVHGDRRIRVHPQNQRTQPPGQLGDAQFPGGEQALNRVVHDPPLPCRGLNFISTVDIFTTRRQPREDT